MFLPQLKGKYQRRRQAASYFPQTGVMAESSYSLLVHKLKAPIIWHYIRSHINLLLSGWEKHPPHEGLPPQQACWWLVRVSTVVQNKICISSIIYRCKVFRWKFLDPPKGMSHMPCNRGQIKHFCKDREFVTHYEFNGIHVHVH